jgi:hypothetical protein
MHVQGDSGFTVRSAIGLSLSAAALTVSAFLLATHGDEQQAIQPMASDIVDFDRGNSLVVPATPLATTPPYGDNDGDTIHDGIDSRPWDSGNDGCRDYNDHCY